MGFSRIIPGTFSDLTADQGVTHKHKGTAAALHAHR